MAREEIIRKVLDKVLWTGNASDDNKRILTNALIEALEQEPCDKQRYVVRGINNDKMEFIDKYSVRAFNRYVEFIEHDKNKVLDKIRAEINSPNRGTCDYFIVDRIEEIIDKYMKEYDEERGTER